MMFLFWPSKPTERTCAASSAQALRVFCLTGVPSFHNKHLLGGGVSSEAAAPPAWAGGLRRAPVGSGVQGPNGQAPRSSPNAATDAGSDASGGTRARSEVTGELGARVWRSRPGPSRPLQLSSGSLRSKEARRPGPAKERGSGA